MKLRVVSPEPVKRLEEDGIDAAGESAIRDALATFKADRILVFSHADEMDYREDEGLEDADERFGFPVTHAEISR